MNSLNSPYSAGLWELRALQGLLSMTVILALVAATANLVGRNRANVRHAFWLGALICVFAVPAFNALFEACGWQLASLRIGLITPTARPAIGTNWNALVAASDWVVETSLARSPSRAQRDGHPEISGHFSNVRSPGQSVTRLASAATTHNAITRFLFAGVVSIWFLGSAIFAVRLGVGWTRLGRLRREAESVPPDRWQPDLRRVRLALGRDLLPPIFLSRIAQVPMVAGLLKPCVILPEPLARSMSSQELEETLIHECAHIKRRDQWVLMLQHLAVVLFWPHPLIHYLNKQLGRAREELCDNYVLATSRPVGYAETLLRLAQVCLPAPKCGLGLGVLRRGADLEDRIRCLIDNKRDRQITVAGLPRFGIATALLLLVGVASAVRVDSREAQNGPAEAQSAVQLGRAEAVNQSAGAQMKKESMPDIEQRVQALTKDWTTNELFETADTWAEQVRQLILIGKPAVPALTQMLDETDADLPLRLLGFTLRAIGDPRAVPALVRAIPRTLRPPGSDCGVSLKDPQLLEFMQQQCSTKPGHRYFDDHGYFDMSRPVREISGAIERLTGSTQGEQELFNTFLVGGRQQRDLQRFLYIQVAHRWADWWRTNWSRFSTDPALAEIHLPPLPFIQPGPGRFSGGPDAKVTDGMANVVVGSIEEGNTRCFIDLDTSRCLGWPQMAAAPNTQTISIEDVCAWAGGEGMDLVGVKYSLPGSSKVYYALRAIGLQAYEISNERWDTIADELRSGAPLDFGRPAGGLLIHQDEANGGYIPNRKATFLFITREGTPGILRVVGQVVEPGASESAENTAGTKEDALEAFRKRYGLTERVKDSSPDQKVDRSGLPFPGVKIEYKFFCSE